MSNTPFPLSAAGDTAVVVEVEVEEEGSMRDLMGLIKFRREAREKDEAAREVAGWRRGWRASGNFMAAAAG